MSAKEQLLEDRKRIERDWYNNVYEKGEEFSSHAIREGLLGESENYFRMRISQLSKSGIRILEIGCGGGEHAIAAAEQGAHVTAIDISTEGIDRARDNARRAGVEDRCDFRVGDCENLDFAPASFDVVLDHEVLSSVEPRRAIAEGLRVLKPGGIFLGIECFGHNPIFNLNRTIKTRRGTRTAWATAHILKMGDLKEAAKCSSALQVRYFHLVAVYAGPIMLRLPALLRRIFSPPISLLDALLLRTFLSRYCFKVVFELTK